MNNKGFRKEYIILVVVIVGLLAYLLLRNPNRMHYDLPEMKTIDGETLTKIEINRPEGKIVLVKAEEKWVIDPQKYPMDESKVKEITDTVKDLKLTALASSAGDYARYNLNKEKKIDVIAYAGDSVVREFEVGKPTSTRNHTFIKLKDDKNVYHAGKSFRRYFEQKVDELRDKTVMKLDKNAVSGLTVEKDGAVLAFNKTVKDKPESMVTPVADKEATDKKEADKEATVKKDSDKKIEVQPQQPVHPADAIWVMADGKEGNKSELESVIDQLVDLKCDEYIADKKKEDFSEPVYKLVVKGQKDYELMFYGKIKVGEKGDTEKYPVVSSESPYPFLLSTYKAERMMKTFEDLQKK